MGSNSRTRSPSIDPPPPSRRRLDSGRSKDFRDLPWSAGWRDWAALPRDVLWVILSLLPQADVPRGAGLACASWWRAALDEQLLWRRIDLAADEDEDKDANPPAAWRTMARTAVRRSDGRCESYRGRVDGDFLLFLARRAASLRSLHVVSGEFVAVAAKKFPMLEQIVLSGGLIEEALLVALVDHCPRLQLLHARGCHTRFPIGKTLLVRLESKINDLQLPHQAVNPMPCTIV